MKTTVPRAPLALLRLILPARSREAILGDLEEEYRGAVLPLRRRWDAKRWLWREALRIAGAYVVDRILGPAAEPKPRRRPRKGDGMLGWTSDLRYAFRTLAKSSGVTAVAVATLAVGIGATTAISSVVSAVLVEPLPYREPERLVMVWENDRLRGTRKERASGPDYFDFKAESRLLESIAGFTTPQMSLTSADAEPERVRAALVTHTLFETLGVRPILGRTFGAGEDHPGGERVVVLSESFWRRRYGGSRDALGRTVVLDGIQGTVIGVVPASFAFPSDVLRASAPTEVWLPLRYSPASGRRGQHNVAVVARLRRDASLDAARAEMTALARSLEERYPNDNLGRGAWLSPIAEEMVEEVKPALLVLAAAVVAVLLIACVNVANLLMARAAARAREVAIRAALGAGRTRLLRQFTIEGLLLTVTASVLGLVLARWGMALLVRLAPAGIPRLDAAALDGRVLGLTLGVSLATGLFFGIFPAFYAARRGLQQTLREGAATSDLDARRERFRKALVVAEVALAVMLVVAAGLLVQSFRRLGGVDPGFDPRGVLNVEIELPPSRYEQVFGKFPRWTQVTRFWTEVVERVGRLPGVESAAVAHNHPLDRGWTTRFGIEGRPPVAAGEQDEVAIRPVSPGYFRTVGLPLLAGRGLTERDTVDAPAVAVVNGSLARRYFAGEEPIGKKIAFFGRMREIVGIVGNERFFGLGEGTPPAIYPPIAQAPMGSASLLVRASGDVGGLLPSVRREVAALDRDLPLFGVAPLESMLSASIAGPRFNMLVLGAFAVVALGLGALGVYGLLSYAVERRTQEIGVRMALGARASDVLRMIVGRGLRLTLYGVAIGLPASLLATRALSRLLFGVTAADPATYTATAVVLVAVGLVASYLPARRATKVDPLVALRHE